MQSHRDEHRAYSAWINLPQIHAALNNDTQSAPCASVDQMNASWAGSPCTVPGSNVTVPQVWSVPLSNTTISTGQPCKAGNSIDRIVTSTLLGEQLLAVGEPAHLQYVRSIG